MLEKLALLIKRTELTPATMPIYRAPYRAGCSSRKIEEAELSRTRDAGVMDFKIAESLAVFVPRKIGT